MRDPAFARSLEALAGSNYAFLDYAFLPWGWIPTLDDLSVPLPYAILYFADGQASAAGASWLGDLLLYCVQHAPKGAHAEVATRVLLTYSPDALAALHTLARCATQPSFVFKDLVTDYPRR